MTIQQEDIKDLARRQLDKRLNRIREGIPFLTAPRGGWVKALRSAYGMSQTDLASRMRISRQAVAQLERREAEGGITLKALEQAADALGAEVVYAIVPRQPLTDTLEERALKIARQMTGSVRHSMRLEDQEPTSDTEERTRRLAAKLLAKPGQLWSEADE
jgi:predicted DNA-binding mobile mystery protein A